MNSIWFVDNQTGWAVGGGGFTLHTTNGGQTWAKQDLGVYRIMWGIQFLDNQTGWTVGEQNEVRNTTDGGQTWNPVPFPGYTYLNALHFLDNHTGWVVGDNGTLMKYDACSAVKVQNPTDLSSNIALYPNPATEQITIENNNPTAITKLVFYNALGVSCASIQQSIGAGESVQVQLPQLSGGLYFVSLETGGPGQGRVMKCLMLLEE